MIKKYNLLLVDDHELLTSLIESQINQKQNSRFRVLKTVSTGVDAINFSDLRKVDVVLLDIYMPGMNGEQTARLILKKHPSISIIALSAIAEKRQIIRMLQIGVKGYISKTGNLSEIEDAIIKVKEENQLYLSPTFGADFMGEILQEVLSSPVLLEDSTLTERELYIIACITQGFTSKEIAKKLNLSSRTIEKYRVQIMSKTGTRDVPGLTKYAIKNGIISLS